MDNNSIFSGTMADMTFDEIEKYIEKEAVVLFPIGVIEEHGPHLPLGTDIYLAYSILKHTQTELSKMNITSIIAPPFYWGINVATGSFTGSFTVKEETMKVVLKDTVECLDKWGFKKVFFLNVHGDFLHCKTILDATKEMFESDFKISTYNIIPEFFKERHELNGDEPYVLFQKDNKESEVQDSPYFDIHAGGPETSSMIVQHKDLVDLNKAKKLRSSKTTYNLFRKWIQGGDEVKEITPLGYCGDPSNINIEEAEKDFKDYSKITAELIKSCNT